MSNNYQKIDNTVVQPSTLVAGASDVLNLQGLRIASGKATLTATSATGYYALVNNDGGNITLGPQEVVIATTLYAPGLTGSGTVAVGTSVVAATGPLAPTFVATPPTTSVVASGFATPNTAAAGNAANAAASYATVAVSGSVSAGTLYSNLYIVNADIASTT